MLAILLAEPRDSVGRDQIIEGVWGEEASDANRHSFHTYLSNLRGILGDVIVRAGDVYRLDPEKVEVDHLAFSAAEEEARRLVATDPEGTAARLREALGRWRGRPYADLADVPGLEGEIRRLEELRLEAVELRIDAELASGLHGTLVAELEALAEEHPLRERFRAPAHPQPRPGKSRSSRRSFAGLLYRRHRLRHPGRLRLGIPIILTRRASRSPAGNRPTTECRAAPLEGGTGIQSHPSPLPRVGL